MTGFKPKRKDLQIGSRVTLTPSSDYFGQHYRLQYTNSNLGTILRISTDWDDDFPYSVYWDWEKQRDIEHAGHPRNNPGFCYRLRDLLLVIQNNEEASERLPSYEDTYY